MLRFLKKNDFIEKDFSNILTSMSLNDIAETLKNISSPCEFEYSDKYFMRIMNEAIILMAMINNIITIKYK